MKFNSSKGGSNSTSTGQTHKSAQAKQQQHQTFGNRHPSFHTTSSHNKVIHHPSIINSQAGRDGPPSSGLSHSIMQQIGTTH